MDKLLAVFFLLLALPFMIGLLIQALSAAIVALLPMILLVAAFMGIVAGATAGLFLRRCFTPRASADRPDPEFPVPPPDPTHRPRGRQRER